MNTSAFIIGATRSGAGKTTITMGILASLVKQGYNVQPFKCGPDFIDPTLHRWVTGNTSYNLDIKMMGETCCRQTFQAHGAEADVIVIEGVMGLFDGGVASTSAVAKALGLPVILIIDAQSSAESTVAVLNGFENFDPDVTIGGVIFNRIGSERHKQLIDDTVRSNSSVEVLGYVPRETEFSIPERHLGLHMGTEKPMEDTALEKLATSMEQCLDLKRLLVSCRTEISGGTRTAQTSLVQSQRRRLGLARDEAFCFYYEQNLELLEQVGFDVIPFSPIHDPHPPEHLDMLYFCGGYPELHADRLSQNHTMHRGIQKYHHRDTPIYAECGGFMYLCNTLSDTAGCVYPMVGVFPLHTAMNPRLRRLGYREVTLTDGCIFGPAGTMLHGHEFHYSDLVEPVECGDKNSNIKCLYTLDNNSYEGYSIGSALGSYIHLHFGKSKDVLEFMCNLLKS